MKTNVANEAEIFSTMIAAEGLSISREAAQSILAIQFTTAQQSRMHELLDRNRQGRITPEEQEEMECYRRVGNFLSLLKSKARLALRNSDTADVA